MNRFDYDVAIIGGGSAGFAAARTAADAGLKTVVIEGGNEVGGLCILRGCMPSKALLYSAEVLHLARNSSVFGIRSGNIGFDFQKVMARKKRLIKEFADCRREQLKFGRFKFIRANARFIDAHTVELSDPNGTCDGQSRQRRGLRQPSAALGAVTAQRKAPEDWRTPKPDGNLTAQHFIIATGSVVSPPPLPQLADVGYITSDEALSLKRLPKSLIVLGGGAVACELAQFLARFDVSVTMIQRSPHVLKEFDADAASVIETVFRREGMRLFTGTHLLDAWRDGKWKGVSFRHRGRIVRVQAEEILFALGRTPNTASLCLSNAGVKTQDALIPADERMRTNVPHIYTAGDCTGPHEIVHIAVQQGETAARNIANSRRQRRMDYRLFTNVVFTDPQIATVGLTEKAARENKVSFMSASYPFNDHGKSLIMEAKDGFVKLLANPRTGEILGGCCAGPLAGDLIHEIVAAMAKRMTVHELSAMPHYHPTLAEIWTYPAEELTVQISRRG